VHASYEYVCLIKISSVIQTLSAAHIKSY